MKFFIVSIRRSTGNWIECYESEEIELATDHAFMMAKEGFEIQITHAPIIEGDINV